MSKFKGTKGMLILIVLVCAVIGYYYYVANRGPKAEESKMTEETAEITPVQNVLMRNLETNYPPTPKEVVKYYAEITQCFYSEDYTEEELEQLALKIQQLYDAELVAVKDQETYMQDLKDDIANFEADGYKITGFYTSSSTDVEEFSDNGYDWARLYCTFYLTAGKNKNFNTQEKFLLRKDEAGHWKIYGWELAE